MKCDEFKKRIEELFDVPENNESEPDKALLEHIASCGDCREYYREFENVVAMLTPCKNMGGVRREATVENKCKVQVEAEAPSRRSVFRRWLSAVAAVVVVVVGIGLYHISATEARASTATELFDRAVEAMGHNLKFSTTLMVRTLPDENFNYIDVSVPFVEHRLCAGTAAGRRTWSLSKGGRHYVVCDGEAQYQWWTGKDKAFIQPVADDVIDYFSVIADVAQLMSYEKMCAAQHSGDSYTTSRTDSTVTLTVMSGPKYSPHPLLGSSHSQDYLNNIREYCFDTATGRLLGLRFWVVTDGRRQLVLYSRDMKYGAAAVLPEATDIPLESHTWTDMRQFAESGPDSRSAVLNDETAAGAAKRIITAITAGDATDAREALAAYDTATLFAQYSGYKFVAVRDTFRSDGYSGVYVVVELRSPDKGHSILRLALRNDNRLGLWVLDGGI
ncbi:hypothetical protein [Xylanibacter muris]|uniref:Zinc-finger domain-containing protein n=1 Tax=Xylanibacter muris TaxID=2736290 RepID=A0ABX2AKL4_9BACT|nr:hypothetical protein [Xylanibacter muris]NPD91746.1 hypothetical protein [Xylanibacter muris]